MAILASSRRGTASQWPFWSRPAAGRRLNGRFGLIPPRDGVSMAILISSRRGTASQRLFWSRPAAGRRLNGRFDIVPSRDGVSMAILVLSCRMTEVLSDIWVQKKRPLQTQTLATISHSCMNCRPPWKESLIKKPNSGKRGIRTPGTVTRTPHFECGPFDHSGIFPFSEERANVK